MSHSHHVLGLAMFACAIAAGAPLCDADEPLRVGSSIVGRRGDQGQASTRGREPVAGCPLRFDELTTDSGIACLFVGLLGAHCPQRAIAMFAGDGTAMVVLLALSPGGPSLYLPAHAQSAAEARIVGWRNDLDFATAPSAGRVTLDEGGRRLRVVLDHASVPLGACSLENYSGKFVTLVSKRGENPSGRDARLPWWEASLRDGRLSDSIRPRRRDSDE